MKKYFLLALMVVPTYGATLTYPAARNQFTPDATNAGLNVGSYAGNPSTLVNGDVWYNSTTGSLMFRQAGFNLAIQPLIGVEGLAINRIENLQAALDSKPGVSNKTGTHAAPSTTTPLSPLWNGNMHTVWYGVTGTINLPAAAGYANRGILIYNTGAFTITVDPAASEAVVRDGTVQTGGVSFTLSSGSGNFVALISDGVRWITLGYKGTLSVGS